MQFLFTNVLTQQPDDQSRKQHKPKYNTHAQNKQIK